MFLGTQTLQRPQQKITQKEWGFPHRSNPGSRPAPSCKVGSVGVPPGWSGPRSCGRYVSRSAPRRDARSGRVKDIRGRGRAQPPAPSQRSRRGKAAASRVPGASNPRAPFLDFPAQAPSASVPFTHRRKKLNVPYKRQGKQGIRRRKTYFCNRNGGRERKGVRVWNFRRMVRHWRLLRGSRCQERNSRRGWCRGLSRPKQSCRCNFLPG